MRLFWAVELSDEARAQIDAAADPLRMRWPELRWTDPAGWHLTVAFLGEVADEVADRLPGAVAARLATRSVDPTADRSRGIEVRIAGRAETPGGSRGIVWLPVWDPGGHLSRVAAATAAACTSEGVSVDRRRPFRPHLTLARVPRRTAEDPGSLAATVAGAFTGRPTVVAVTQIVLLQSHRTQAGSTYVPRGRVTV